MVWTPGGGTRFGSSIRISGMNAQRLLLHSCGTVFTTILTWYAQPRRACLLFLPRKPKKCITRKLSDAVGLTACSSSALECGFSYVEIVRSLSNMRDFGNTHRCDKSLVF